VAKDHHLDVAVQIGGASEKLDKAAQQQVDEREEHGRTPEEKERHDPTNSLAEAMIAGFRALQVALVVHRSGPIALQKASWAGPDGS
jgi:hypothetical protein